MTPDKRARLGLGLALAVAALLRFWALSQGIGFNPGVDEPEIMERAVRMMKTLHPRGGSGLDHPLPGGRDAG